MERTTISIGKIIEQIKDGFIVLPQFQRGYVWDMKQALKYLDSLYNLYPTGSLLIWETSNLPKIRTINNDITNGNARVLLDGQQRLTTIYSIAKGCPPPFYDGKPYPQEIYIDLEADIEKNQDLFVHLPNGKPKDKINYVSVSQVLMLGIDKFIETNISNNTIDETAKNYYLKHFTKIQKLTSILNYEYYEHVIENKWDLDQIVDIFNRVNAQGIRLGPPDFALAYICASWPEARDEIKNLLNEVREKTGYDFGIEYIVRLISIDNLSNARLSKINPDRDHMGKEFTRDKLIHSWQKIKKAIPYSINILKKECLIANNDSLSNFPFLILWYYLIQQEGQYFHTDVEKKEMLLWFIESQIWARYTGPSETLLDKDVKLVKDSKSKGLLAELKKTNSLRKIETKDITQKGKLQGLFPVFIASLKHTKAKDWVTGQIIDEENIGDMNKIELHHIFPKDFLKKNGLSLADGAGKAKANELANMAIITKTANIGILNNAPIKYLEDVERSHPGSLDSQSVPKNKALWDFKNFDDFLTNRRLLITNAMNQYITDLTGF